MNLSDLDRGLEIYWAEIGGRSAEVQRREAAFPEFVARFNKRSPAHFVREDLVEIITWKHTDARWRQRALDGLAAVPDESIAERTSRISQLQDPSDGISAFAGWAAGVGPATISAILAAARPDRWPVIDVFALEALASRIDSAWVARIPRDEQGRAIADVRTWNDYVLECRGLADVANASSDSTGSHWSPRRIDMALWGLGKLDRSATKVIDHVVRAAAPSAPHPENVMQASRILIGKVRDTDSKGAVRNWEVCFDRSAHGADFPKAHGSSIEVEWPSGSYSSLVGIKENNPIYLRTAAKSLDGKVDTRVSDLCIKHGLGRAGPIKFEVLEYQRRYRVIDQS